MNASHDNTLVPNFHLKLVRAGLLFVVCCFLHVGSATSQTFVQAKDRFDRLADEVGGRMASAYEIQVDPAGFIWFAGDTEGLLRFDGHEFIVWPDTNSTDFSRTNFSAIRIAQDGRLWIGGWGNGLHYWSREKNAFVSANTAPGDPNALASDRVQRLFVDHGGRLWIGTTAGLNYIDPGAPDQLRRFALDSPDHPLRSERIWGIAELEQALWFATSNGLYRLSPDRSTWQHYLLHDKASTEAERANEARTVAVVEGHVWAGGRNGVYKYDRSTDRFIAIPLEQVSTTAPPRINTLAEDGMGNLYVGAHNGLYRIDLFSDQFVKQGDSFALLRDIDIRSLHADTSSNLWVGTRDNGILRGRLREPAFSSLNHEAPVQFSEDLTRLTSAVHTDTEGFLWLGVASSVFRRDPNGNWQRWSFPEGNPVRRIERIRTAPNGLTWIATSDGLFMINGEDHLSEDRRLFELLDINVRPVNDLLIDPSGTLWVALWNYGVVKWRPAENLQKRYLEQLQETSGDFVYQLSQAVDGRIWAATRFTGVHESNGEDFVQLQPSLDRWPRNQSIYCAVPANQYLWLCGDFGLLQYNAETRESWRYGLIEGLPSRRMTSFFESESGDQWVLTPNGIAWRNAESKDFMTFGRRDGLPSLTIQRNAIAEASEGSIVVGTARGAMRLNPENLPQQSAAPHTVLSRLWISGEEWTRRVNPIEPRIELPYNNRDIMLQFSVMDFSEPERNRLRYRLSGFEDDFGPLTSERTVRYMNLPSGDFTLQVQGWSSRGIAGETLLEVPIHVATPWWRTPFAGLMFFSVLALAVWTIIWLRLRVARAANIRLRADIAAATEELQQANARLEDLAITDFLTGLLNRRGFIQRFEQLQALLQRNPSSLAVMLIDLDHFKRINDSFGHEVGDGVLRTLARVLLETLRGADIAARWGGEEFLVALPGTDQNGAEKVCDKIRDGLLHADFDQGEKLPPVTATFGVVFVPCSREINLDALVAQADELLYKGKEQGRDTVIQADASPKD